MVYPNDLFDAPPVSPGCNDTQGDHAWWVAHTKPRQEKALARHLLGAGVSYFLPQHLKETRRRRHRQQSWNPVFPGYVFFVADDDDRVEALKSNRIASLLNVASQEDLVTDLRRVHRLVTSDLPLFPEQRLQPGMQVRITGGPLMGLKGTIEQHRSACRFVVSVTFLQQGVSAEIDASEVEPLQDDQ